MCVEIMSCYIPSVYCAWDLSLHRARRARLRPGTASRPVQPQVLPAEYQSLHVRLEIRAVWVDPLLTDGDEPAGRGAFVTEFRSTAHVITSFAANCCDV